jgi:hypothetical protein
MQDYEFPGTIELGTSSAQVALRRLEIGADDLGAPQTCGRCAWPAGLPLQERLDRVEGAVLDALEHTR